MRLTPYNSNPEWLIEQGLLEIYLFLAHRLHGFSLNEFWEMDSFAASYLYCQCYNIMKNEEEMMKGDGKSTPEQAYKLSEDELFDETKF